GEILALRLPGGALGLRERPANLGPGGANDTAAFARETEGGGPRRRLEHREPGAEVADQLLAVLQRSRHVRGRDLPVLDEELQRDRGVLRGDPELILRLASHESSLRRPMRRSDRTSGPRAAGGFPDPAVGCRLARVALSST